MNIESLFLATPELTDEQNKLKLEASAFLAQHPVLQETFDTSIKCGVVDALGLLRERKFEEAYASLLGADRIMELKDVFETSKEQLKHTEKAAEKPKKTGSIKYN